MGSQSQYLLLLLLCVLITLPLESFSRVYRRPLRLLITLLPVVVIFGVWDVAAIAAGHWRYNPQYVTGIRLIARIPVEEVAFFVVVPICGLLTYGAVGRLINRPRVPTGTDRAPER